MSETSESIKADAKPFGGGFVAADGRMTPNARKTAAAIRREQLIATDLTTVTPFERGGESFSIATWGRNDRTLIREDSSRTREGAGEFVLSETDLSDAERFSLILLRHGVRDENGDLYFEVADILDYRANEEDAELLADLLTQVIKANPKLFDADTIVEAGGDGKKKVTS